jgi:glycosyltransferase involved in cell wall biosynthesis
MSIVSFCVPTYNRGKKVYDLVVSVLNQSYNYDFEIIVLDNVSKDNTAELMRSIDDERFHYYVNDESLIGPLNIIKSLTYANGRYAFLCLDKDFIDANFIDDLIDRLVKCPEIVSGYCVLNLDGVVEDKIYQKGFHSLYNMAYLSAHPTGMFYKTALLKESAYLVRIFDNRSIFGFYPDILNAELGMLGSTCRIGVPIFKTESLDECENVKSFTFTTEDKLFFTPKNRFIALVFYLNHLLNFDLESGSKLFLVKKIFRDQLISALWEYKRILLNASLCKHYHINTRNVGVLEILKIYGFFSLAFFKYDLGLSRYEKVSVIFTQSFLLFSSYVKRFLIPPKRTFEI